MFKRSLQQEKQFKNNTYINYKKKEYHTRDYRDGQNTNAVKGTIVPREVEEFKGIRGYTVKYFTFYYNNQYYIYKEAKYKVSYWPQKLRPKLFKGIEEVDLLYKLDKDLMVIYS